VSTPDQEARAAMFTDYVHSVVDNPVFVGCHYFKYADEPLTGRPGDGENTASDSRQSSTACTPKWSQRPKK